ncbi:low-density lipoprotein receptor-like [Mytilus trossulus]|uniref:low-density lipoprotein receptor-like n=1 Tax=Mytilus trossulus TaxID=6551 RepID=UPI00300530FC
MKVILIFGMFVGTALCCSSDQYTCEDGECIPGSWQCDSYVDCSKGEDDMGCTGCDSDRFHCSDFPLCVKWWGVCDGIDDCGDNSDERGCANLCWYDLPYSKRGLTSSSAEKVVSRGINKRGKVEAAGTNMHKKENEAQKIANKMEKLRLLSRGKDGK